MFAPAELEQHIRPRAELGHVGVIEPAQQAVLVLHAGNARQAQPLAAQRGGRLVVELTPAEAAALGDELKAVTS